MYDLIIIGAGGAGLSAAWEAHNNGLSNICVLDCQKSTGGTTKMSGGFFYAIDTDLSNKEAGASCLHEAVKDSLEFHHYENINPELIRNWLTESKKTIEWITSLGYKFSIFDKKHPNTHLLGELRKHTMSHLIGDITKTLIKDGVTFIYEIEVTRILRGVSGGVRGVSVRDKSGNERIIAGRTVVLSCGGFISNRAELHKQFPNTYTEFAYQFPLRNPGNGITLAKSAGAKCVNNCTLVIENGYCLTPDFRRRLFKEPGRIHASIGAIWVNKQGKRYCNEDLWQENYAARALLSQPGKIGYALFNPKTLEIALKASADKKFSAKDYEHKLLEFEREGLCRFSDDLNGIAEWIGAKTSVLEDTLNEYNQYCYKGVDELLGKESSHLIAIENGPYLAVKIVPLYIDTIGPICTDGNLRVLDEDLQAIPGFFCAGAICAGWMGRDYYKPGSNLSFAFSSGRIAGRTVVNDLKSLYI